jgi:hypothetical protein
MKEMLVKPEEQYRKLLAEHLPKSVQESNLRQVADFNRGVTQ